MSTPPPAKRQKLAPSHGDGAAAAVPGCWALPQALMIAMMFLVRMRVRVRNKVTVKLNLPQFRSLIQLSVDLAFQRSHEMYSRKIEGLLQQLARPCSICHSDQHTRLEPNQEHADANGSNGSNTNIRLRFLNSTLKKRIYSERNITNKNNAAIKVAIFNGEEIITVGDLSKVKVEILVLRGDFRDKESEDWSDEKIDSYIDTEIGSLGTWRLNKGEVDLSEIRFNKGTNRRPVIMAARVCKGERSIPRVQGAIMDPMVVLDRRNEGNEKRYPPNLDDEVFRLEEISRNGPYRGRLKEAEIFTVEDFLKAFYKDQKNLCKILQMENKRDPWSKLTRHAMQCVLEHRQELKRYQSEDGTVVLFFNCVHNIVGADFGCGYVASGAFTTAQTASVNKWKIYAYEKLDDILADFIIQGTNPRRISSSTDAAPGPSNQVVDASQPNVSAVHHPTLSAYQGIGAAEDSPHGDSNHITPPIYPAVNNDPVISAPGYPNTQDNQGTGGVENSCQGDINQIMTPIYPNANSDPMISVTRYINTMGNQGTGASQNSPHGDINHITRPIYPNANSDPMISATHYINTLGQGTRAIENSPHVDINHVTVPIYPNANSDPMISTPGYLNTQDNEAQGIALPVQQPITQGSNMRDSDLLQNPATLMLSSTIEWENIEVSDFSEGLDLGDIIFCSSTMPPEGTCCCFTTGAPQPSCVEHGQGPRHLAALCFQDDQATATTASKQIGRP